MRDWKCDYCLNGRTIISENGLHTTCCLSEKKAVDCMMGKRDYCCPVPSVEEGEGNNAK